MYSIVVPVYNGEKTVEALFQQTQKFFDSKKLSFEMIFVYDFGPENSWEVLTRLKQEYPSKIFIIKLSRNFGQHNATICGIESSKGEFIITMDEDLQHNPFDIERLINEQSKADYDVVYGKYENRQHSNTRNLGSWFLKKMIVVGIPDIHPDYSSFRLIKKNIAKSTVNMHNSYTFLDGYISWITTNCSSCIVRHNFRQGGESSYSFKKLIDHTVNIFITFSNYPLRLVTIGSIFIFIFTVVYSFYVIYRKLVYDDFVMGYPSIIISIGFGISAILLTLGIIGEYIYRINLKTTKRPNYYISHKE